ncbi:MAG: N-acetyl-gamma-glutamyl-phosphate reductase [Candidatus Saccharimonadales bacterium]
MKSVDVAVLGASGYIGHEAAETLAGHPFAGNVLTPSTEELPEFAGSEVIFTALPHGTSAEYVAKFSGLGSTVIDFTGEFRFQTAEKYESSYGQSHPAPDLLPVPYGLPEHSREDLRGKSIAAIPGCYPTGALLALRPLIDNDMIEPNHPIFIDAVSAVSGAGKTPSELTHFMNISGNAIPYKTGDVHRHVGEIEQFLEDRPVLFSPMIINLERGMHVASNVILPTGVTAEEAREVLITRYSGEPFVQVLDEDRLPAVKDTSGTDECHIGVVGVGQAVQLGSSLDNLRKGGSSQGVHAFNIMMGYPETAGLTSKASMRP